MLLYVDMELKWEKSLVKKRVHVLFSGMVQGVGFRFTSRYLANSHKIKGWVKNLAGGRVELDVEGEEDKLKSFLEDLKQEFKRYISDFELKELSVFEEYNDFQIKF